MLFPLGFSFFSALEVQGGDHTLKDSQQSVVHHERAPTLELVFRFPNVHGAVQMAGTSNVMTDAVTSVWVLAEHVFPGDVTAAKSIAYLAALPVSCRMSILSSLSFPM